MRRKKTGRQAGAGVCESSSAITAVIPGARMPRQFQTNIGKIRVQVLAPVQLRFRTQFH